MGRDGSGGVLIMFVPAIVPEKSREIKSVTKKKKKKKKKDTFLAFLALL